MTAWSELPLWPAPGEATAGLFAVEARRAAAAGLRIRPLEATVADTWAWLRDGGEPAAWRAELRAKGLGAARERALLAEWTS